MNKAHRSDEQLVKDYLNGDTGAFAELVKRYEGRLLYFAWRWVNDYHKAEDIIQETFRAVWQDLRSFNPDRKFSAWIYSICKARCFDYLRKTQRRAAFVSMPDEETWLAPLATRSNDEPDLDTQKIKTECLASLDDKDQLFYKLKREEHKSYEEIAQHPAFQGVRPEALMMRFSRLCDKLRVYLRDKKYIE